jgi:methanogenic corrinoid protein MtbC1
MDVNRFMELALAGETAQAVRFALDLLDTGTSYGSVISDVLAPAQRRVGQLWQLNRLTVADEYLASGVTESTLYALSSAVPSAAFGATAGAGPVVFACAEGEWHSVAAHMISELLRAEGTTTVYLGASTPPGDVGRFVERQRPAALAVSCTVPLSYKGVTKLADVAHAHGIPVLAGGAALRGAPRRARLLGADGYGDTVAEAVEALTAWGGSSPVVVAQAAAGCPEADQLESRAGALADLAFTDLNVRFPALASYTLGQRDRTREDLAEIVAFVAAAWRVDDRTVFIDFLDWLTVLLEGRGVPRAALASGVGVLQAHLDRFSAIAGQIAAAGLEHLST